VRDKREEKKRKGGYAVPKIPLKVLAQLHTKPL